ncbi:hypothetical protein [uncultured Paraglaciecola sp.]|uniref:hypothetical protein n=1 Tax=uncultured Paraglaciecola sp. TaxID=1765024 RepID=UPI00262B4CDC|nr:hypothetical protein [uncultured Paraglaciecola sp.]
MADNLEELITELCSTQQLRGKVIQAASLQKSYDEWVQGGRAAEGPDHEQLHLVFQYGIIYAVDMLAKKMKAGQYYHGDGSESLDGDLSITIDNVFRASGLAHENGDVMTIEEIKNA